MNLVFFIEPFLDSSHSYPNFFQPYYDQFLLPWASNLKDYAKSNKKSCEIRFVMSEALLANCKQDKRFSYKVIDLNKITKIFDNYQEYLANKKIGNSKKLGQYSEIISQKLEDFKPDLIIGCSVDISFLEKLFPKIPILYNESGLFSGVKEFAHTLYFDLIRNNKSFLLNHKKQLNELEITKEKEEFIKILTESLQNSIIQSESYKILKERLKKLPYKKYALFALQRWSSELMQMNTDHKSEIAYIEDILENIDSDIGIVITMHKASSIVGQKIIQNYLINKYPNIIFIDDLDSPSNSAILLCDFVITTSSTVGFYAAFFKKKLLVPSKNSWLNFIADSNSLKDFKNEMKRPNQIQNKENILFYLLFHYCIPSSYVKDGKWFYNFCTNLVKINPDKADLNYYPKIDEVRAVFNLHQEKYLKTTSKKKRKRLIFFG